jgi:hypothetical protein
MKKIVILLVIVIILLATVQQVVANSGFQSDKSEMELAFWNSIKDSTRSSEYQAYLNKYPNGTFAELARDRMKLYSNPANTFVPLPARTGPREIARDGHFIAFEDNTVLDTETKLMWADVDNGEDIDAIESKIYCENFRGGNYLDWRMPTKAEIIQLLNSPNSQPLEEGILCKSASITRLINVTSSGIWVSDFIECTKGQGIFRRPADCAAWINLCDKYCYAYLVDESEGYRALPVRSLSPEQGREVQAREVSNLRSSYRMVSMDEAISMLKRFNFYDQIKNPSAKGISHQYQSRTISGDRVVIDGATGLMWLQSGSDNQGWLAKLNRIGYAGYSDWRLPTLEEGASLVESSKRNGDLYIDPVFSDAQIYIWTGDSDSSSESWMVSFRPGLVNGDYNVSINYVRPVRSGK